MFENKAMAACLVIACIIIALMFNSENESEVSVKSDSSVTQKSDSRNDAAPIAQNDIRMEATNSTNSTVSRSDGAMGAMPSIESSSLSEELVNNNTNDVDAIGGYFDESAIAPEDEVPQNNFIDSIGYEDPTAEDPAMSSEGLPEDESIKAPIDDDTIM